jgi:hypothetical protein
MLSQLRLASPRVEWSPSCDPWKARTARTLLDLRLSGVIP